MTKVLNSILVALAVTFLAGYALAMRSIVLDPSVYAARAELFALGVTLCVFVAIVANRSRLVHLSPFHGVLPNRTVEATLVAVGMLFVAISAFFVLR